MTERDFQRAVTETADWLGWKVFHPSPTPANYGSGTVWMTAGSHGFPDLVLAHKKHGVLFVELKTDSGRLSTLQMQWLHTLVDGGAEAYVWRPSMMPQIVERLKGGRP